MTHGPTLRDDDPLRLAHERPVRFDKGLLTFDQRERGDGSSRCQNELFHFENEKVHFDKEDILVVLGV